MKCIYLRTNIVNGKQYVGQTNDMKKRDYQWYNTDMVYAGTYITNARNKYGTENFKTKILKECETQEQLNFWEQYYIKKLNTKVPNGYNLTDGGDGISGYHFSVESKKKMSDAKIGKYVGENSWNYGVKRSDEFKTALSERQKGKKHTEEWKKNMSVNNPKYWLGKHRSIIEKEKMSKKKDDVKRKVYQYDLNNKLIHIYDSIAECGRCGYNIGAVGACCRGVDGYKTHKGYKWLFKPM